MNQRRFVALAMTIGIAAPVIWLTVNWIFLRGDPALGNLVLSSYRFDRVLLALWPSSTLLMADPVEQSVATPVAAVAVNALLYGAIGWLMWFGLHRRRFVLPGIAAGVLAGWYLLLRWYG